MTQNKESMFYTYQTILKNARKCSVTMSKEELLNMLETLNRMHELSVLQLALQKKLNPDSTLKAMQNILFAEKNMVEGIYEGKTDAELIEQMFQVDYDATLFENLNQELWPITNEE